MTSEDSDVLPMPTGVAETGFAAAEEVPLEERKKRILEALSKEQLRVFDWVRKREKRGDWKDFRKKVGKPSPRLTIVEFVKKQILQDGEGDA